MGNRASACGGTDLHGEDALKETFRLDPGEVVLVAGKFSDHVGRYMVHCHMLQHEDHGMMTGFEVMPEGHGDVLAPGLDAALAASITDASLRDQVKRVVLSARGGAPAPRSALPTLEAEAAASVRALLSDRSSNAYTCRVN